jgi:hypothetical protein
MAKIMYRVVKADNGLNATVATVAGLPRPVLAIYFSLYPETASSKQGHTLPISHSLRQEITILIPTLPLRGPKAMFAVSVLDNRNDQLSDVLLLPPLRTKEHTTISEVKASEVVVLKLRPNTVQQVQNSQLGRNLCEPRSGYSMSKVQLIDDECKTAPVI